MGLICCTSRPDAEAADDEGAQGADDEGAEAADDEGAEAFHAKPPTLRPEDDFRQPSSPSVQYSPVVV